jgi:hypothetical protein
MQHKHKRIEYYKNPLRCCRCKSIIPFEKRLKKKFGSVYCGNSCSTASTLNSTHWSEVVKNQVSNNQKIKQKEIWTKEKRKKHSIKMRKVVNQNPDSYSRNNVCGRVKSIKIVDSFGNETKCLGRWELLVAEYLNAHGIKWTNRIDEIFEYQWNDSTHRYFPDFKTDQGYIEVKGYERERDRCKWAQFPYPLVVIKIDGIKSIKNGTFLLTF